MEYTVKHRLDDLSRVKTVVEKAYDSYKTRLADNDPKIRWVDDENAKIAFTVLGKTIEVDLSIDAKEIRLFGDLPFLFRPFQSKILGVLGREMEKWLEKGRAGEI